mmetsp:Transcript_8546/g.23999  ORF Transcript_8546/g.23999 Transcript_8546/m.23999 type:complete len:285 (-) Transcript_8546:610-1464(-)
MRIPAIWTPSASRTTNIQISLTLGARPSTCISEHARGHLVVLEVLVMLFQVFGSLVPPAQLAEGLRKIHAVPSLRRLGHRRREHPRHLGHVPRPFRNHVCQELRQSGGDNGLLRMRHCGLHQALRHLAEVLQERHCLVRHPPIIFKLAQKQECRRRCTHELLDFCKKLRVARCPLLWAQLPCLVQPQPQAEEVPAGVAGRARELRPLPGHAHCLPQVERCVGPAVGHDEGLTPLLHASYWRTVSQGRQDFLLPKSDWFVQGPRRSVRKRSRSLQVPPLPARKKC